MLLADDPGTVVRNHPSGGGSPSNSPNTKSPSAGGEGGSDVLAGFGGDSVFAIDEFIGALSWVAGSTDILRAIDMVFLSTCAASALEQVANVRDAHTKAVALLLDTLENIFKRGQEIFPVLTEFSFTERASVADAVARQMEVGKGECRGRGGEADGGRNERVSRTVGARQMEVANFHFRARILEK